MKEDRINFRKILVFLGIILVAVTVFFGIILKIKNVKSQEKVAAVKIEEGVKQEPTIAPTASVSPAPISFEEMNQKYGPCVRVSVLMYHHIQNEEEAKSKNQTSLTVTPDFFKEQIQYLKKQNYRIIEPKDLMAFFENTENLSGKLAMITLDDGYEDNYTNAFPILKELGVRATIFVPTGLMNNPDYLTWDQMNEMRDSVYFGNHTWSHHSSGGSEEKQDEEIGLADKQLIEKGFNEQKVFAYPYGKPSGNAEAVLKNKKYQIAFTTTHGNIMCKGKAFELPRIRVGNAPLSNYGI